VEAKPSLVRGRRRDARPDIEDDEARKGGEQSQGEDDEGGRDEKKSQWESNGEKKKGGGRLTAAAAVVKPPRTTKQRRHKENKKKTKRKFGLTKFGTDGRKYPSLKHFPRHTCWRVFQPDALSKGGGERRGNGNGTRRQGKSVK
jgi:hypothetical protein